MISLGNKNILVTGGAGFVGSNLVRTLVEKHGANVTVLDDLFNSTEENLAGIDHQFVLGSVEDKEIVNECVKGKDIVFHLAARNILVCNHHPRKDLNVNVVGSYNVLEACLEHKVKRVVYTSTSSVYGNAKKLPIREEDEKSFLNFYSASKHTAEVYCKTFYEVFDLPVTILRYSNIYGPFQTPANPYCGVIGKFINNATVGLPLKIYGNGEQTRDYTYIDDAIDATIAAAVNPQAIGQEYNIGTGIQTSVNDLAKAIVDITNTSSSVQYVDNRDIDNIQHRSIDITKAKKELHFQPTFTVDKGLHSTVNWFLQSLTKAGAFAIANLFVA
jgi:UDP-glucose 4-epimerase